MISFFGRVKPANLIRLAGFLKSGPEFDRYKIRTVDLYPDFNHQIKIGDCKPRVYSYKHNYKCPDIDRSHQFVNGLDQKRHPKNWEGLSHIDRKVCQMFHLNALRTERRLVKNENGSITINGGGYKKTSEIYPFDINKAPKSIREWGKDTI